MLRFVPALARLLGLALLFATASCGSDAGSGQSGMASLIEPLASIDSPLAGQISIGGVTRTAVALDLLVTRSGHWRFSDLGAVGDSRAYLWRLDENAEFVRVMVCRRAFTTEAGDGSALSLQSVAVKMVYRGKIYLWTLAVPQGACRIMQNMEPVAPRAEWLREAVAQLRIPSYKRERAWYPGLPLLARDLSRGAYSATSLGPVPGWPLSTPTSSSNFVGVTAAQGGEYASSRGFLHDADARVVDAALHNEDALIAAFMPEFTQYTFYSLAQPQAAVWSTVNHITVDPQYPLAGDRPFEIARAAQRRRDDIDSVIPADDWSRDESHLENTGYVHWILTEDPVAGMLVQRQLAYVLGNVYEANRPRPMPGYMINIIQERGLYNALSAIWKARDVSRRVASTNGDVIWGASRFDRIVGESFANIDEQLKALPDRDVAAVTGAVLRDIGVGEWQLRDGTTAFYALESNFQGFQYGKEPLWLWAKDGNAKAAGWLAAKARQAVVRTLYIGGALGVDRAEDIAGSSLPLGPSMPGPFGYPIPAPTPFKSDFEWAKWVGSLPIAVQPTDRYDGAALHTAMQMHEMLLFAKDAKLAVPELDTAISRMDLFRRRTSNFAYAGLQMHKQLGGPPN